MENINNSPSLLSRILLGIGTGGLSELALNQRNNLDNETRQANSIVAGSQIPAFAYKEQSPDQINNAKALQLANLGISGDEMFKEFAPTPDRQLNNEEKRAQIQNLLSEVSLRNETIKKSRIDQKAQEAINTFRSDLFPTLIEPGQAPQGPADFSGATLPVIPPQITTDPDKLQRAATNALLMGDTTTAEGLNKMQRNRNLNQQDIAKTEYYKAKAAGADTTNITPTVVDANGIPITGEAYKKTLPPVRAIAAQALIEGRGIWPTGTYAKSPAGQQLLADAQLLDPTLDANTFKARGKTQIEYGAGGSVGKNIVTLRTAIDHILHLSEDAEKLPDTGFQYGNKLLNKAGAQTGDTSITNYMTTLNTAVPEIVKAYVPTGGTEADRNQMRDNFDPKLTKEQKRQSIAKQADLMLNRLEEMQARYDETMGQGTKPLVSPTTKAKLEALKNGTPAAIAQKIHQQAPKAPVIKGVYKRVNGKLVKVQ